jgi:hypothetical protein
MIFKSVTKRALNNQIRKETVTKGNFFNLKQVFQFFLSVSLKYTLNRHFKLNELKIKLQTE